jgi:hypothetical protein
VSISVARWGVYIEEKSGGIWFVFGFKLNILSEILLLFLFQEKKVPAKIILRNKCSTQYSSIPKKINPT